MAADLKLRVIEAAKQSFSSFGYKATSMERVAQQAGVGKGTIYTFFDSKEQLFDHIIMDLIQKTLALLHCAEHTNAPFSERLQQGLASILRLRQKQELFVKLAQEVQMYGTAEVKAGLQRVEEEIVRFIQA